jgi:hypothetical protein
MRKTTVIIAISALACAASAQPAAPPAIPQVSGVTVEGKLNGLPKEQCKEKDSVCIQQVVAALHALTGVEKQKFDIWCMANETARMRRGAYYGGGREDSGGNAISTERSAVDEGEGVQAACEAPAKHASR